MQYRANKKQSCKDKELQANFAEYPIFFRRAVKKKMRKAAVKFGKEWGACDQYLPVAACVKFATEKYECRPASKRKEATHNNNQ